MTDIDWSTYTDEELLEIQMGANTERTRRQQLEDIPEQMADLNEQYLDVAGIEPGEEWGQPQGAHDAYPKDWRVSHEGQDWISLVDANVWEPGQANWRQEAAPGEYPEWVQPVGSEDAYDIGDRVHYSSTGLDYESTLDANVWPPDVTGWVVLP